MGPEPAIRKRMFGSDWRMGGMAAIRREVPLL